MKLKLCFYLTLALVVSCAKSKQTFYEYNDFIFGSYIKIKVIADDSIKVKQAIDETMVMLHHIDSVVSIFNPNSELSRINENKVGKMSADLKALITKSIEVSEKSNGAFDITIGPAMKTYGLYEIATETQIIPKKDKKEDNSQYCPRLSGNLADYIGYRKIQIKDDSIFLKPGMMLDLGGIAVGYAVDKACEILISKGIKDGLIDAGGDIICFGNKSFKIGIKNPKGQGIIKTIALKNQAISTSGNYEKFFERDNKKFCHIINPKTGNAITDTSGSLSSVTIIANKCVDADAYATAVFVLGIDDGQNLIRKLKYKGILITNDGKIIEVK